MQRLHFIILISVFLLVGQGCAGKKQNIPLADEFWQQKPQAKITIASFVDPIAQLVPRGQIGLLDLVIIDTANKNLNNSLKHHNLAIYHELNKRFVTEFKKRNIPVTIANNLTSEKAEKSLIAQLDNGNLLTIQLINIGVAREYYGFIPRSYPQAFCWLQGKLINPINNTELWYHKTEIIEPIVGKWDEPPHYSNILAALDRALANATQELLDSFFSGH